MNYKTYFRSLLMMGLGLLLFQSCVKSDDFSVPPIVCQDKFGPTNHELSDLQAIAKLAPTAGDVIQSDYIVEGYVSSSDEAGNIFKMLFIQDKPQDPTFAIEVDIDGSNTHVDFPVGAKVRLNLKGLIVQAEANNIKVGTFDPNFAVGRINPNRIADYIARVCGTGGTSIISQIVPQEFASIADALQPGNINKLIKIDNVEFADAELTKNFADASATGDRNITTEDGTQLDLRMSNFANFATMPISPKYAGSGSVTLILSRFHSTYQGYIRSIDDVNFTQPRFPVLGPGAVRPPSANAKLLFAGANFEDWNAFLSGLNSFGILDYATQGGGLGLNGTNSLHIKGVPTKNDYLFTALAPTGLPNSPTRIVMYVNGTASGKSLSFNVYKTDGSYYVFNLGDFTTSEAYSTSATNNYNGSIDTGGKWQLIQLNLNGLSNINTTPGKSVFALKTGTGGNYNLNIDNVTIE